MKNPRFRVWDDTMKLMEYFSIGTTMDVEELNIMMGSGKLDKHGEEIFEGDIIYLKKEEISERGESRDHEIERICTIVYEDGAFLIEISPYVKDYLRDFIVDHWTVVEFKIIGNIYQPPSK